MDAWANVSHHLDYKSDRDVPAELRKDFYALSGLFYVADRHFEMFHSQSKVSREQMKEVFEAAASGDEKKSQELNLDSLAAYLEAKFPDRERAGPKDLSDLLNPLLKSGYKTIGEIDEMIDKGEAAFRLYEEERPPFAKQGNRFTDIGVVRITMKILSERFLCEDHRSTTPDEVELKKIVREQWAKGEKYRKLIE